MPRLVVDTHAALWYLFADDRLSKAAREAMDAALEAGDSIALSAISLVEIIYLVDKGRISEQAWQRVREEMGQDAPSLISVPIDERLLPHIQQVPRSEVPDLPDRLIAATALMLDLPLVTRDPEIQSSSIRTIW